MGWDGAGRGPAGSAWEGGFDAITGWSPWESGADARPLYGRITGPVPGKIVQQIETRVGRRPRPTETRTETESGAGEP